MLGGALQSCWWAHRDTLSEHQRRRNSRCGRCGRCGEHASWYDPGTLVTDVFLLPVPHPLPTSACALPALTSPLQTITSSPLQSKDVTSDDHPLSLAQSSQWNVYFQVSGEQRGGG